MVFTENGFTSRGQFVDAVLRKSGLTMREFAARIKVSYNRLSQMKRNRALVSDAVMGRIACEFQLNYQVTYSLDYGPLGDKPILNNSVLRCNCDLAKRMEGAFSVMPTPVWDGWGELVDLDYALQYINTAELIYLHEQEMIGAVKSSPESPESYRLTFKGRQFIIDAQKIEGLEL